MREKTVERAVSDGEKESEREKEIESCSKGEMERIIKRIKEV